MSNVDLHIHSIISGDADYSVEQLLLLAQQAGLDIVSITDHNKIGNVKAAQELFAKEGIKVIAGTEIDCRFHGMDLHILGYNINVEDEVFAQIEQHYHQQDIVVTWQMVNNLETIFGIEFDYDLLRGMAKSGVIVPEDVAELLIQDRRYHHMNWMKPYLQGGLRADNPNVNFYWDMMAQGRVAHVPMELPAVQEVIDIIHRGGGKAVIAHPGNNFKSRMTDFYQLLNETDIDGVEVCSSYHSPAQTLEFFQAAKARNLLMTCGSDFHGKNKPSIQMGKIDFCGMDQSLFYRGE